MVLFDWQTARRSANTRDLAYFIAYALSVEMRRAYEKDLLELYHQTLLAHGIVDYSMEQLRCGYRRSLGNALITLVIAAAMLDFSGERGILLQKAICDRVGSAVDDHDFAVWLPAYLGIPCGEA